MGVCALCYMCQVWCSGIQGIYAQLTGGQSAMGMCALCYISQVLCSGTQGIYAQLTGGFDLPCIYMRYAISARSAKFGVAVFKAPLLDWGSIYHRSMLPHYTSPPAN